MFTNRRPEVSVNANFHKKLKYEHSTDFSEYNQNKKAHIIYCIDNSGSMKTEFRSQESFQCVIDMMTDQYHGDTMLSQCQLYSMLSFNTITSLHFEKCLLSQYLISDVKKIKDTIKPHHGTDFSKAFQKIEEIVSKDRVQDPWTSFTYFVIFLSDGRPGDLPWPVSPKGQEPLKTKSHRVIFPSAIHHLLNLTKALSDRMNLFTVGIGKEEDSKWLERLVDIANVQGSYGRFLLPRNIRSNPMGGLGRSIPSPPPTQQQPPHPSTLPYSTLNPNSKPYYPLKPACMTTSTTTAIPSYYVFPQTTPFPTMSASNTTTISTRISSDIPIIKIEDSLQPRIRSSKKRSIHHDDDDDVSLLDSLITSYPSLFDDPRINHPSPTYAFPVADAAVADIGTRTAVGGKYHSNQVTIKNEKNQDFIFPRPTLPPSSFITSMKPPCSQPNHHRSSQPNTSSQSNNIFDCYSKYLQGSTTTSSSNNNNNRNNHNSTNNSTQMLPPTFARVPVTLTPATSNTNNTSNTNTATLQDAFRSISSQLTQTLTLTMSQDSTGGTARHRIPTLPALRDLKLEHASTTSSDTTERSYEAIKMILNMKNKAQPVFEAEEGVYRIVQLRNQPFAVGGERYAYHLFDNTDSSTATTTSTINGYLSGGGGRRSYSNHFVAKESKNREHYHDRLKFHMPMVIAQTISSQLAVEFNSLLRKYGQGDDYQESEYQDMMIRFLPCYIYRIRDETVSGQFRYLATEPYLEQTYVKYNGNNGTVKSSPEGMFRDIPNMIAQAFSHWTYEYTKQQQEEIVKKKSSNSSSTLTAYEGQMLVCDIQGTGTTYTDPSICTSGEGGVFGKSDLGRKGWKSFFSSHNCNSICSLLHLNSLCTGCED